MTETQTNENKPSVVDDFFSALFANKTGNGNDTVHPAPGTISSPTTTITPLNDSENIDKNKESTSEINETKPNVGTVLDEFDEYSLLSSRKQTDNPTGRTNSTSLRYPGDSPAQILARRDIDWSTVSPESRMLVRQLPKAVDKQEIMDYFSKYGEVIEVVQKNSFGFVHFENPEICARAVAAENGKIFNGVVLDLEICKRKPYFARALEEGRKTANRRETSPPPRRRDFSPSRSRSRSPPRRQKRKTSLTRNNNNEHNRRPSMNNNNNQRNRQTQQDYNNYPNSYNNDVNRYEQPRQNETNTGYNANNSNYRRPDPRLTEFKQQGYANHVNQTSLIPSRTGKDIPVVQIISWSNAYYKFVSQVENTFAQYAIRTSTSVVQYSQSNRDEIVKQMVLEGVKALIIIDSLNESRHKVYLQVFTSNGNGEGVRFDEYDSVTPIEAVNIVQRFHPQSTQPEQKSYQGYNPQYNSQANSQYASQTKISPPTYNQPLAQYSGTQPHYSTQQSVYTPPQTYNSSQSYNSLQPYNSSQPYLPQQPQPQPQQTSIDPNTVAAILGLLQNKPGNSLVSQAPAPAVPAVVSSQPSIPQLLATLMNGLNVQSGVTGSPSQTQVTLPLTTLTTAPVHVASPAVAAPSLDQSNIAALLSTASNGNPALAQLLYQMTTGNNSTPSQPSNSQSRMNNSNLN